MMLCGVCPNCGEEVTIPRQEGPFECPACGETYRMTRQAGAWVVQRQQSPRARTAPDDRLTRFELQIAPAGLRLVVLPDQPVLFNNALPGKRGRTYLLDGESEAFFAGLEYLVHNVANLFDLPERAADRAFNAAALRSMSLHVRAACADERQWASVFVPDRVPDSVSLLVDLAREFAGEMVVRLGAVPVSDEAARAALERG